MAILMFAARKHELIRSINAKQAKMMAISRKIHDLQQYAANIGDGSISLSDMMNTPSSQFGRSLWFMQISHNQAMQAAVNGAPMVMMQYGIGNNIDPNMKAQYEQWIMQNLYKQEKERLCKVEAKQLNVQEQELMDQKTQLEAQIKMEEQELESVKKAEEEGIKQFAPKYTANA